MLAMICRVCLLNVKKNAVLCAQCSLIAHSKCAGSSPPTCDLRAQLLLYAQYAEKGNPASAYSNPLDLLNEVQTANLPAGAMSDVAYVSHTPRTSLDLPRPQPPSSPPPKPRSKVAPHPPSAASTSFKFMAAFKRSRALSPEPHQHTSSPSPSLPSDRPEENVVRKAGVLRSTKARPVSLSSSGTTPNTSSLRSAATAAESFSSRQAVGRSDAGTRASAGRFSGMADSDGRRSSRVTAVSELSADVAETQRPDRIPGELPVDDKPRSKKRDSKSSGNGCTVQ
jgi:hypothetical protein